EEYWNTHLFNLAHQITRMQDASQTSQRPIRQSVRSDSPSIECGDTSESRARGLLSFVDDADLSDSEHYIPSTTRERAIGERPSPLHVYDASSNGRGSGTTHVRSGSSGGDVGSVVQSFVAASNGEILCGSTSFMFLLPPSCWYIRRKSRAKSEPTFSFYGTEIFLTYARCDILHIDICNYFEFMFEHVCGVHLVEHCIGVEFHQDGTPHVHAWLRFSRRVCAVNASAFDLVLRESSSESSSPDDDDGNRSFRWFHPNI